MKLRLILLFFVIAPICFLSCQNKNGKKFSLNGEVLTTNDSCPYILVKYTKQDSPKGTILFSQGKDKATNDSITGLLNRIGFDVVELKSKGSLKNELKAYRLIKNNTQLKLKNNYTCIIGIADGARYSALTMNELENEEQPNDLILINPEGFNKTIAGTVFPLVNPPLTTNTTLLCIVDTLLVNKTAAKSFGEYEKTWIGYDNDAFYCKTSGINGFVKTLTEFFDGDITFEKAKGNPAALPVEGYYPKRHADKVKLSQKHKYDLIFVGNSITHNFEKPQYQAVWEKYFGSRNALNLGYSGYRTENIIWNIKHGELDGQSPKVIILEIGTNNIDEVHYPTRHTAGQLAGGIKEIVKNLRNKCPDSKIILLRCFPGCYGGPKPTSHRRILERASDIASSLADNKHIFYCDVNHVFLNMDGSINHAMLGDWLHPTPAGAKAWAQAMEPLLSQLMGDKSKDNKISDNPAIVPAVNLENNSYDWFARHNEILNIKDSLNPEIVLIGNSITHLWGGKYPPFRNADGSLRKPYGAEAWDKTFSNHSVLNLGFGWDRTQNVLWRLDNGELDGLNPKLVVIHVGTNNTSDTKSARANTAPEIVEGIKAIYLRVRSKIPRAKIVLMAIMPREEKPDNPRRKLIKETNKILKTFAAGNNITLLDISSEMLTSDKILTKEIAFDFCHPTNNGYQIWGDALKPYIEKL